MPCSKCCMDKAILQGEQCHVEMLTKHCYEMSNVMQKVLLGESTITGEAMPHISIE